MKVRSNLKAGSSASSMDDFCGGLCGAELGDAYQRGLESCKG